MWFQQIKNFSKISFDVIVLSDGSFLVAGTIQINSKGNLFVAKFTSTCTLDTTFGTTGIATYSALFGTSGRALVVQSDGKIIAAGQGKSNENGVVKKLNVKKGDEDKKSWGIIISTIVDDQFRKTIKQYGSKYTDDQYFDWFKKWFPNMIEKIKIEWRTKNLYVLI